MSGIAQLQARQLARKGRYGDDSILHVSKAEVAGLDALARSMYGHDLPRNPETGQKEAFLFLPMLAPLLASTGVLGAGLTGLGALGTGALAAGAGTLEAAARGYDDPLQHGLMSGITAGAGSMLGQGLQAAGGAGVDAAAQAGAMPGIDATAGAVGTGQSQLMAAQNAQVLGHDAAAGVLQGGGGMSDAMMYTPTGTPDFSVTAASPVPSMPPKSFFEGFGDISGVSGSTDRYMQNVKNVMTDPAKSKAFLDNPDTLKGTIGMVGGMMGQDQLEQAQAAKEAGEAREAESDAKYRQGVAKIKQAYADAGRDPWWNDPNRLRDFGVGYKYADGGQVFPMQSGGFVVPKYAVDAAGGGSNEKGLAALKRHVGAKPIRGKGTGTSDSIKATIDGAQPARVSNGEAYVSPEKVKKAGGSRQFYQMLNAAKKSRARRA